jgi:hypothetical protein
MVIMRKLILLISVILIIQSTQAQLTDVMSTLKAFTPDTASGWKKNATLFLNVSQTSLTNWAAGGRNSLSVNGLFTMDINYREVKINWDNSFETGYGVMNQSDGGGFIKTDDRINAATKFGYKVFDKWYFSGLLSLKTQLNKGYYYPNDSVVISRFMAPGYFVGAIGMDFKPTDYFSAFFSPVTCKTTFVLDKALADSGSYGVTRGQRSRSEVGGFVRMLYRKELVENVSVDMRADFFSNYLKKPGNIDIDWEMRLSLKINKLMSASVSMNLLYDDDVKLEIDSDRDGIVDRRGPRVQFKELFAVGFVLKF